MRGRLMIGLVAGGALVAGGVVAWGVRSGSEVDEAGRVSPTAVRYPTPSLSRKYRARKPPPPRTVYEQAIDEAHRQGVSVWLDAQMIYPWSRGRQALTQAAAELGRQAQRPGVAGIKFADEIGNGDGLSSAGQIRRFLAETSRALREAAPGVPLLVDTYVPEFGCLPGDARPAAAACRAEFRGEYPLLTAENVESYLLTGWIDAVHLAPDLRERRTYTAWGVSYEDAQRAYWREVGRRRWASTIAVYGRTAALAHAGKWRKGRATTERLVFSESDLLFAGGAQMVHLWTWRQQYEGAYRQLTDPGLAPNALWRALRSRRSAGARYSTLFIPDGPQAGIAQDLRMLREVFSDVFLWTGVGTP